MKTALQVIGLFAALLTGVAIFVLSLGILIEIPDRVAYLAPPHPAEMPAGWLLLTDGNGAYRIAYPIEERKHWEFFGRHDVWPKDYASDCEAVEWAWFHKGNDVESRIERRNRKPAPPDTRTWTRADNQFCQPK